MPGILQSAQPQAQPQPVNHEEVMNRTGKMVIAAQQIMYGDKTSAMFMKQLQTAGKTPEERAGNAAAGVMALLMQHTDGKIDPRTIVPAGVIIVADMMDFIGQTEGQKFGEEENNEAIKIFLEKLTQAAGGQPDGTPETPQDEQQEAQQPMQGAM